MQRKYRFLLLICTGFILINLVSGTVFAATYTYSEKNNNRTVNAKVNDRIVLVLAENPTTGYLWNLSAPSGLVLTRDTYISSDKSKKLVGSGGKHYWYFTLKKAGLKVINGTYMRSWIGPEPASQTFRLAINVTGPVERRR